MTVYTLYSIKKSLIYNGESSPIVIVSHEPSFGIPYAVEFSSCGGVVYHRFIISLHDDMYTTSKFFLTTIIFENNRQLIYKVKRPKDIAFGMQAITKEFMLDHTKQKIRLKPSTLFQLLHPKKYFVGFDSTEVQGSVKSNLATCK